MKLLSIAFVLASLTTTAVMAESASTRSTKNTLQATVLAPTWVPMMTLLGCAMDGGSENECLLQVSASAAPISSTTLLLLKEDIKNVEGDAYEFLAGAPATLALEEVIESIREEDGLEDPSDEEIVSMMLQSI